MGSEWFGWSGRVTHPNAPAGGGGPGHFGRSQLAERDLDLPSPWTPRATREIPLQGAPAPAKKNPAPLTVPRSLGALMDIQDEMHDVHVEAEILADGGSAPKAGARTAFGGAGAFTAPSATTSGNKVVAFTSKFVWKGTIQIQTAYASSSDPDHVSCYGRGTTDDDVKSGNITLGFHESCHRADYVTYLKTHALPDPPRFSVGMTADAYRKAARDFEKALGAYFTKMESDSHAKTDEVGHRRSTYRATKRCYRHILR